MAEGGSEGETRSDREHEEWREDWRGKGALIAVQLSSWRISKMNVSVNP